MTDSAESQRREDRVSLFVMANLHAEARGGPVKLRNISPGGALIEGEVLPRRGSAVALCKGELTVPGAVVWRNANRAGLSFASPTDVSRWLPSAQAQRSASETFRRLKAEQAQHPGSRVTRAPLHTSFVSTEEMERAAAALDDLADILALDDRIVVEVASKLQSLDIAAQLLRKVAARRD